MGIQSITVEIPKGKSAARATFTTSADTKKPVASPAHNIRLPPMVAYYVRQSDKLGNGDIHTIMVDLRLMEVARSDGKIVFHIVTEDAIEFEHYNTVTR